MSDDNHESIKQMIIIDHVHPLKERVIGIEKSVEHHEKLTEQRFNVVDERMSRAERVLNDIVVKVDENHELVKRIWNAMWGGAIAAIAIWSIVKFVIPLMG